MNDASKIQIPLLMGEVRGRDIVDGQNNIICYQSDIDMKISRIAKNISLWTLHLNRLALYICRICTVLHSLPIFAEREPFFRPIFPFPNAINGIVMDETEVWIWKDSDFPREKFLDFSPENSHLNSSSTNIVWSLRSPHYTESTVNLRPCHHEEWGRDKLWRTKTLSE